MNKELSSLINVGLSKIICNIFNTLKYFNNKVPFGNIKTGHHLSIFKEHWFPIPICGLKMIVIMKGLKMLRLIKLYE